MELKDLLERKVLILDGGLGTMIQKNGFGENDFRGREFISHPVSIGGFNDILNLTKPNSIKEVHLKYLEAGADIITTNTFNSNYISLSDYGLNKIEGLVKRLNRVGAILAKECVKEFNPNLKDKKIFVAGSIGPTNRSASLSPDITDPIKRNVEYDKLYEAYKEQISGLIEGGVDILLFETFFDTLNLKAGLDAAESMMESKGLSLPIMVSATVSDNSGHLLSGQNLAAFVTTINDYKNIISIGLNCGFGPDRMLQHMEEISRFSNHFISCHPNAGLPDETGAYAVSSSDFQKEVDKLMKSGKINIIGGCCGTTPEHISLLSDIVKKYKPYIPSDNLAGLRLSGNEVLIHKNDEGLLIIGERCNVAGSRKFLRLIKEQKLEEAAEIAKVEIEAGAKVIDINMDDPMLDAPLEMKSFVRYISSEPEIAKVPFMIDSSNEEVIMTALKNIQGKGIVNSLSLKEGEEIFISRAKRVKELGFALIVMAFDEKGQAESYERKVEISHRAYKILTEKCGYNPEDIIFDVNVMAIATGIPEHSRYAIEFLRAVEWIKANLPGAKTSGGISNLSFSFRGKNKIREYMHSVFLYHAVKVGLDMAIVNPSAMIDYHTIPEDIKTIIEDVILTGNQESENKLLKLVVSEEKPGKNAIDNFDRNSLSLEDRIKDNMVKGELKYVESDLKDALEKGMDPLSIIDGPLMSGMKEVGKLFGEGKMFLPQVVKTARVMNVAVDYLKPFLLKDNEGNKKGSGGTILIATVKGDVHDIGKNIVGTILACNGFEVVDLGVMVPSEQIISKIKDIKPDILCLSGLITPSLSEMITVVRTLEKEGVDLPVMVGGAATSPLHTLLKIAPNYSGHVFHMSDASQNPIAAKRLLNSSSKEDFLKEIKEKNDLILKAFKGKNPDLLTYKEALSKSENNKKEFKGNAEFKVSQDKFGKNIITDLKLKVILPLINWKMFFNAWKLHGIYTENFPHSLDDKDIESWISSFSDEVKPKAMQALDLYRETIKILDEIESAGIFNGKALYRIESVKADDMNIYVADHIFPMLRQQGRESQCLSLTDYISDNDNIGFFVVTAGTGLNKFEKEYKEKGDEFRSLIVQALGDRIAEASAEWLQRNVAEGIRPAWGYPMLPDQKMILNTKDFIPFEEMGIRLTENGAMEPSSSVSGLFIANKKAKYFVLGNIGEDQLKDYAERRGMETETMRILLRQN